MDLYGCNLSRGYNLNKCLENLFHLRYLGLCSTSIVELPEEIGNLQFLHILDISANHISRLPTNVVQLKQMMCLNLHWPTRLSNGIGSLTSLEKLSCLTVDDSNIDIIEELGQLTELSVLNISLNEWNGKLMECLHKLKKIQDLRIKAGGDQKNIGGLDAWVAPRCLRSLSTQWCCWFSKLPVWMNGSHLSYLSSLSIAVREVQQGDLDIFGSLHVLRYLDLLVGHLDLGILDGFIVGAGSFASLIYCDFDGFVRPIVFQQGAMPRLRTLRSRSSVRGAIEIGSTDGVGLDFGLGLLPSLQDIIVVFYSRGASKEEAEEVMAALRHATKIHPNRPNLGIYVCD